MATRQAPTIQELASVLAEGEIASVRTMISKLGYYDRDQKHLSIVGLRLVLMEKTMRIKAYLFDQAQQYLSNEGPGNQSGNNNNTNADQANNNSNEDDDSNNADADDDDDSRDLFSLVARRETAQLQSILITWYSATLYSLDPTQLLKEMIQYTFEVQLDELPPLLNYQHLDVGKPCIVLRLFNEVPETEGQIIAVSTSSSTTSYWISFPSEPQIDMSPFPSNRIRIPENDNDVYQETEREAAAVDAKNVAKKAKMDTDVPPYKRHISQVTSHIPFAINDVAASTRFDPPLNSTSSLSSNSSTSSSSNSFSSSSSSSLNETGVSISLPSSSSSTAVVCGLWTLTNYNIELKKIVFGRSFKTHTISHTRTSSKFNVLRSLTKKKSLIFQIMCKENLLQYLGK